MSMPGWMEIVVIIAILVILFGGPKARDTLSKMGKNVYKVKKEIDDIKKIDIK